MIPGGCTSTIQPLDVSINKPVKGVLKTAWEQYMIELPISPPTKQNLVDWVADANNYEDGLK